MDVVVVGTGYVGLVAACCLVNSGHRVVAVEKDPAKLAVHEEGRVPFYEEQLEEIMQNALNRGALRFTSGLAGVLRGAALVLLAVGTPSLPDGRVDLSQVYAAMQEVIRHATDELTVVMKSTVPPGTGRTISKRFLAHCRVPIHYVSNPEFLREGKAVWDWYHPDRIVVGCDDESTAQQVLKLYADIDAPKVVMNVTSAEMVKYASNAFLAAKISYINEIANLCELVG
ncbi:MAG: nucleotide sugar dehydrogenase [Bacillota bacterium]